MILPPLSDFPADGLVLAMTIAAYLIARKTLRALIRIVRINVSGVRS